MTFASVEEWADFVAHAVTYGQDAQLYLSGDRNVGIIGGRTLRRPENRQAEILAALKSRPTLRAFSGSSEPTGWSATVRASKERLELDIHDVVGGGLFGGGVTSSAVVKAIRQSGDVGTIRVLLNSRGGDVEEGVAIYNRLVNHPARVEVHVEGLAASIASVIAMAGDVRTMSASARMMVHDPWGGTSGRAERLRDHAALLEKVRVQMVDIYVSRTGLARTKVSELMSKETWMNAEEALSLGFIDKIMPNKSK